MLQNTTGQSVASSCEKTATRTGYIINPRPSIPSLIANQSSCGRSSFVFITPTPYFWYSNLTSTSAISQSASFETGNLNQSTTYYYSVKDANSCESLKSVVTAEIIPKPSFNISKDWQICKSDSYLNLNLTAIANADKLSI